MGVGYIQVLRAHDLLRTGSLVDESLTGTRESTTRFQVPRTRQYVVCANLRHGALLAGRALPDDSCVNCD